MRNFWRQSNNDNNRNSDIPITVINESAHSQEEELNEEETREREEEERLQREWEEKEAERVRKGLWPSSEWSIDEEELGAVGGYVDNNNMVVEVKKEA